MTSNFLHHAALWTGTSQSLVDLHPAGFSESLVRAITEEVQVGFVIIGDNSIPPTPGQPNSIQFHAALWRGTSGSFVDLHPASARNSQLNGAYGPYQVGFAVLNNQAHAGIWAGMAGSFIDLHLKLGTNYVNSTANAIWTDGTTIRVVGTAEPFPGGLEHAILWRIDGSILPAGPKSRWLYSGRPARARPGYSP